MTTFCEEPLSEPMTPDIKGLVERLCWISRDVVGPLNHDQRVMLTQAADALDRLSTPPAVPATPVAWRWKVAPEQKNWIYSNDPSPVPQFNVEPLYAAISPDCTRNNTMATILHDSDCAVHNMPAMPNGPCDCGADELKAVAAPVPAHSDVRSVLNFVESWVHNPVGAYSVHALDGLFAMTREKIAALSTTAQSGDQK